MLLPLYHLHFPFSPKTLNSSLFFTSPLISYQNPKPSKFCVRNSSSTVNNTETLSKTAIERIAEKLRNLGYIEEEKKNLVQKISHGGSAGEIFLPSSHELPKQRVGYTIDSSWSTPENPIPKPGSGTAITRFRELKKEAVKQKRVERKERLEKREDKVPTLAELTIPQEELRRLRRVGIALRKKLKVGKAGITEGIVNGIHERWRRTELVKIKCEDLCLMNMKRTHDILERKTGGVVVWRSGSTIILYRGANYEYPYFLVDNTTNDNSLDEVSLESDTEDGVVSKEESSLVCTKGTKPGLPTPLNIKAGSALVPGVGSPSRVRFLLPGEAQLVEEADRMLDGLGPRFTDWWGCEPLPIDADLLPAIVPGYRKPFRLLPYGVKPKLTDDEMTTIRRLGRPLPCHFALGRNRNLQGLATAMVKLWEKCEIVKIAVKRGVQNTNSELMADELKRLTGGTLLSRDKEFIAFYRGKDFLPPAVSVAIEERRYPRMHKEKHTIQSSSDETRPELRSSAEEPNSGGAVQEITVEKKRRPRSTESVLKSISSKLSMVLNKKEKAEKLLAELEKAAETQKPEVDREGITEEERYMLKKVGLRMKPFLLLGRRGVFDGTIENMHLHWKYRELVKILASARGREDVHGVAKTLEAESGGILVAVERVNRGYAIIMYRGKNYHRPADLRPRTLLNKRQAMKRSLEAQRCESLKLHVLKLTKNIDELKSQLAKGETEMNHVPSPKYRREESEFETTDNLLGSVESPRSQRISISMESVSDQEAEESGESSSTSLNSDHSMDDIEEAAHLDRLMNFSPKYDEFAKIDGESMPEAARIETSLDDFQDTGDIAHRDSIPNNIPVASQVVTTSVVIDRAEVDVSEQESVSSSLKTGKNLLVSSVDKNQLEKGFDGVPFRAEPLSNRERLILRKQALKTKKRPVLAIGRSNVVTGVAKTIKTHFLKHPLAIVNVKGRAKGTSVQEVVFKLEQATGGVMVSQEPNKVILYRGWGEGEEPPRGALMEKRKSRASSRVVSPELMAAIRVECGLQVQQQRRKPELK